MKHRYSTIIAALYPFALILLSARGAPDGVDAAGTETVRPATEASAPADALLRMVLAQLPREPLAISGSLIVRRPKGLVERKLDFELFADWGNRPARVSYLLRDAFGSTLEQLTVERNSDNKMRFAYAKGNPLREAAPPNLFEAVQETDVSWIDLTLSFLWWRGGRVVGEERIKGRLCDIIAVTAPPGAAGAADSATESPYAFVKLWIDRKQPMMLQAEGYDAAGDPVRRLWVKGFKKIDERWMIKEMEIQSYPVVHRTKLLIHDVKPAAGGAPFGPGETGVGKGSAVAAEPGHGNARDPAPPQVPAR